MTAVTTADRHTTSEIVKEGALHRLQSLKVKAASRGVDVVECPDDMTTEEAVSRLRALESRLKAREGRGE